MTDNQGFEADKDTSSRHERRKSDDSTNFDAVPEPPDAPEYKEPPPAYPGTNGVIVSPNGLEKLKENGLTNGEIPEVTEESEIEKEKQAKRDREPLRFIKWITKRPGLWFGKTN